MAKAVRLQDIAEKLGVSTVTVSKALSGQKGMSENLRQEIRRLADEMGYVPPAARKMTEPAEKRSYYLGILLADKFLDKYVSFYAHLAQLTAAEALSRECYTMLEGISDEMEKNRILPKVLLDHKVDGVIVIGRLEDPYLKELHRSGGVPLIYLDFSNAEIEADSIISDNYYGAYLMTNYLFSRGHRDIGYVGTILATSSITDRYLGYLRAMMEHGVDVPGEWIIADRDAGADGRNEDQFYRLPEKLPTAFVCNCDLSASVLIRKLGERGICVPEDISVVGFDNYLYPGLCEVPLTTYEVNTREMARTAVRNLVKKIQGEPYRKGILTVEGRLIERESVKCLDPDPVALQEVSG